MLGLTHLNRYQAFGIHFLASLVVFAILTALIFFYWFPGILRVADPSWQQILIVIAGVDLVLGPALTLIVFNPAKKSLKMDLSIIAALQIAALAYGSYTVHNTRPLALSLSFPAAGFEILYHDKVTPELADFIKQHQANDKLYIYTGSAPYGADIAKLTTKDLADLPSDTFADWMKKKNGADFPTEDIYTLPLGFNSSYQVNLSTTGELIGWELARETSIQPTTDSK
ncbi:hypothetical protein A3759_04705 [Thalassolituus sp. HI0120]|nr:hypothetical protein A3759_04705 [Thalassolituus sp. HI0120]